MCVCVRGKLILIYLITENEVNFYKEIQLTSLCLQMEIAEKFICIACDDSYRIVNIVDSSCQTLFSYDIEQLRQPFIAINKTTVEHHCGDFLLNCLGDLGMFAGYDGQTTRPPIAWSSHCSQFQIFNPYVLCLCSDAVRIYNINDSKLKQEINLPNAKILKFFADENLMLVATNNQLFALNPLVSYQIEQLFRIKQIDEAIALFESFSVNFEKDSFNRQLKSIKTRAAFIELIENSNYSKSEFLFIEANVDYKEIAKLFPDLIKTASTLTIQEEAYRTAIVGFDAEKSTEAKRMLVNMMLKASSSVQKNEEFVSVLLKLCAETKSPLLSRIEFFSQLPIKYCLQSVSILADSSRFHSQALIYFLADEFEKAFEIWKNLCEKAIVDENFPGFCFVVEQLSKCKDHQLVWKYVDWAMLIDQQMAVEIFTKRSADELTSERMRIDVIVESLEKYRDALCLYLEYLINKKNLKKEKYITQLIGIYLENVIYMLTIPAEIREANWTSELEIARVKLQNILDASTNFRVQPILSKIKEHENVLQRECAILYEKIEEHEKALKIFVYNLNDYKLATNYCLKNSKDSLKMRKQLFNTLFSIYLNPSFSEREKLLKPTLDLLNSQLIGSFDIPKVLDMIPNNWSMKLAGDFLLNVLNSNLNRKRTNLVEKSIANNFRIYLQSEFQELKKEQLYVDDDSRCIKCQKTFDSTVLIRLPSGKLSHTLCKSEAKTSKFDY